MQQEFNSQRIEEPIVVPDLMNGQTIAMLQTVYPLSEADFVRLNSGASKTDAAAVMIFSGVVGYVIGLGPKLETLLMGSAPVMSSAEIKTITVWGLFSLVIYGLGYLLPSERKKVMKKLSSHFEAAKSTQHNSGDRK
ncbi:hypothetical protein [Vogesella mureinivorans]|uniref:hypothetical protein n=1 Tax=Vogesella mureinivorans TaxID=657276 RepID=UPI0011CC8ECB|nr:hypothetical protein [Vogesella mureinivorans]